MIQREVVWEAVLVLKLTGHVQDFVGAKEIVSVDNKTIQCKYSNKITTKYNVKVFLTYSSCVFVLLGSQIALECQYSTLVLCKM